MTLFARYYDDKKLVEYSMSQIEKLIKKESNKELIADIIFHRYYDRYLKIFFYSSDVEKEYTEVIKDVEKKEFRNEFDTEYKSGFIIMVNCCLLIETLASFFEGSNKTIGTGAETFNLVFTKASKYNNPLKEFSTIPFYGKIRCGLLHQGETYDNYKIRRKGKLFNKTEKVINATLFSIHLKAFLESFKAELIQEKWDSEIWDNCRQKLRYIIKNSK